MVRRCGGDATPPSMMVLYFLAPIMKIWVWEILVKVVILANLLILLILVIMGIIVILVHKFLYCGVRTKTSQELRTLSLSQAIHNQKVILNNVVLNCQQCNQCLKCHM